MLQDLFVVLRKISKSKLTLQAISFDDGRNDDIYNIIKGKDSAAFLNLYRKGWRILRLIAGSLNWSNLTREAFWNFEFFLIDLCEEYECPDISVIIQILQLCSYVANNEWGTARKFCEFLVDEKLWPFLNEITEFGIFFAPYEKVNMTENDTFAIDLVHVALRTGHVELLTRLLKFGASVIPLPNSGPNLPVRSIDWATVTVDVFSSRDYFEDFYYLIRKIYKHKLMPRRMVAVFRRLMALYEMEQFPRLDTDLVAALEMVDRAIPDPVVTVQEIERVIKPALDNQWDKRRFQKICQHHGKYFRTCIGELKPKSLRELARFQVRENLRIAKSLPHSISTLKIDKALKDYLLLSK